MGSPPTVDRTLPVESMTATSVGFMFWMPAETRCTIAWTWSALSVTPALVRMNTDAVGSALVATNTVSLGIASLTVAASTPCMAPTVLASSPSSARW
jgi:hypothetical protein